jgi:AcrR family transcriptional regulator
MNRDMRSARGAQPASLHVAREPVQTRAHKTRAALLAAAELELNERGYERTTTKSIADRAGVAAGSFYQYFADKDAVLRQLAEARMQALRARIDGIAARAVSTDPRRSIRAVISEAIEYHRREPGLHTVLSERRHADPALDAMTAASEQAFVEQIEALLAVARYRGDKKAMAFVIFGMIEGAVHTHVLGKAMVSDKRIVAALGEAILTLVMKGTAPASEEG